MLVKVKRDGSIRDVVKRVNLNSQTSAELYVFVDELTGSSFMQNELEPIELRSFDLCAALRVTRATDEEIACALETGRPVVIKSLEDSERITACIRQMIEKRIT